MALLLWLALGSGCFESHERAMRVAEPTEEDAAIPDAEPDRSSPPDADLPDRTVPDAPIPACDEPGGSCAPGEVCEGGRCCTVEGQALDVLVVVNPTTTLEDEIRGLQSGLERFLRVVASGDINGNGRRDPGDFLAYRDIHFGVVSTHLGHRGSASGCLRSERGDDGVLYGETDGCARPRAPFLEYRGDRLHDFIDGAVCALPDVVDCEYGQGLESALYSLTPSTTPTGFRGEPGQGDRQNAGFLRRNSLLMIVFLDRFDDCSMADLNLSDPNQPGVFPGFHAEACQRNPDQVYPTLRYAEGLTALREDSSRLFVGFSVGVPHDMPRAGKTYQEMLDDPRMELRLVSGANIPVCATPTGVGYPARRYVRVAQELESNGVATTVQSQCQALFEPLIAEMIQFAATRVPEPVCP